MCQMPPDLVVGEVSRLRGWSGLGSRPKEVEQLCQLMLRALCPRPDRRPTAEDCRALLAGGGKGVDVEGVSLVSRL
jgi:hypothetical protein